MGYKPIFMQVVLSFRHLESTFLELVFHFLGMNLNHVWTYFSYLSVARLESDIIYRLFRLVRISIHYTSLVGTFFFFTRLEKQLSYINWSKRSVQYCSQHKPWIDHFHQGIEHS